MSKYYSSSRLPLDPRVPLDMNGSPMAVSMSTLKDLVKIGKQRPKNGAIPALDPMEEDTDFECMTPKGFEEQFLEGERWVCCHASCEILRSVASR